MPEQVIENHIEQLTNKAWDMLMQLLKAGQGLTAIRIIKALGGKTAHTYHRRLLNNMVDRGLLERQERPYRGITGRAYYYRVNPEVAPIIRARAW